jgi:hypothetical protein
MVADAAASRALTREIQSIIVALRAICKKSWCKNPGTACFARELLS